MQYIVTKHAAMRYRERIEPCSDFDARDRVRHAAEISLAPSMRQLTYTQRKHSREGKVLSGSAMWRWCPVEGIMLICQRTDDGRAVITTLFRCPPDSEIVKCRKY